MLLFPKHVSALHLTVQQQGSFGSFFSFLFVFIMGKWAREFHSLPSFHVLKPYSNEA
jgi:hypothetical protein